MKNNKAVSAVIGVILMVAITVAIACTVYVYVANIIESGETAEGVYEGYLLEHRYKGDNDYFLKLNTTNGDVFLNVSIEFNTFFEDGNYYQISVNKADRAFKVVELDEEK